MKTCGQFFLTVSAGKWLIASAVLKLECVQAALQSGCLVLKGGTTVSCVAELLFGYPLKISGRLTPKGAWGAVHRTERAYSLLAEKGTLREMDGEVETSLLRMGPGDVIIAGANLIDAQGCAAVLAGSPGGGHWGRAMAAAVAEGARVIIPAGLEKLAPGTVLEAVKTARRKNVDRFEGMACGLFPLTGDIITELEAIRILADVDACVIGRGGVNGGEGGTLFQVVGDDWEVGRLMELVRRCRDREPGGDPASLRGF